jgi:hypothetical protein
VATGEAGLATSAEDAAPGSPGVGLVEGLERLAELHDRGSLTDAEYARAKDELIGHDDGPGAGGAAAGAKP